VNLDLDLDLTISDSEDLDLNLEKEDLDLPLWDLTISLDYGALRPIGEMLSVLLEKLLEGQLYTMQWLTYSTTFKATINLRFI